MNILISNDDGIHAQGIKQLVKAAENVGNITVIAPDRERSTCGHGLTVDSPLRVIEFDNRTYACSGTPADCVLIGLGHFMKDKRPDLVISGINHGANLGQDHFYSGTVAAAREAAIRGIPGIAISLAVQSKDSQNYFDKAAEFIQKFLTHKLYMYIPYMHVLNVNVPNIEPEKIAGVKYAHGGFQKWTEEVTERVDTRGRKYYWIGGQYDGHAPMEGSDCNAISEGFISVELKNLSEVLTTSAEDVEALVKGLQKI